MTKGEAEAIAAAINMANILGRNFHGLKTVRKLAAALQRQFPDWVWTVYPHNRMLLRVERIR